ncbi:MAG: glycosyltransferase family A protein [Saprospiraceae bacterium]
MPFFSIIIPTYNRGYIIRRPIDSIIAQTFKDWELIIVDDGSKDDTKSIIESYHDERIKYVWQVNKERSAARNHGISLAKGEWICFQDSDDEYLPEHLQVLSDGISHNTGYFVFRTGLITSEKGRFVSKSSLEMKNKYDAFPVQNFTTATFHRNIFRELNFNKRLNNGEDSHFFLLVFERFKIFLLPEYTCVYFRETTNKLNYNSQYEKLESYLDLIEKVTKSNNAVIFQCCFISQSLLYHSVKEFKHIPSAIFQNSNFLFKYPRIYLYSLVSYFRIRVIKQTTN